MSDDGLPPGMRKHDVKKTLLPFPLARHDGLIKEELPDEVLVYDLGSHEAHCLNRIAAAVWRRCNGRTSVAELSRAVSDEFGVAVPEEAIRYAIKRLNESGLMYSAGTPATDRRMSRRALLGMLTKAGTVGILMPLVITIAAGSPAYAASARGTQVLITMFVNQGNQTIVGGGANTCNASGKGKTQVCTFSYTLGSTVVLTSTSGGATNSTVFWLGDCAPCPGGSGLPTLFCTTTLDTNKDCTITYA